MEENINETYNEASHNNIDLSQQKMKIRQFQKLKNRTEQNINEIYNESYILILFNLR